MLPRPPPEGPRRPVHLAAHRLCADVSHRGRRTSMLSISTLHVVLNATMTGPRDRDGARVGRIQRCGREGRDPRQSREILLKPGDARVAPQELDHRRARGGL